VHYGLAVRSHEPSDFLRAEGLLVEVNRLGGIRYNEVRSDRVISIWNCFSHILPFVFGNKAEASSDREVFPVKF